MKAGSFFHKGFILDGAGNGRAIDAAASKRWTPDQGMLLIVLDRHHAECGRWLTESAGLDELIVEVIMAHEPRPRLTVRGGGLLVTMRGVNLNEGDHPEDMVAVRGWFDPEKVILLRGRRVYAVEDLAAALQKRAGPTRAGEVLVQLVDALTDRISDTLDEMDTEADTLEAAAEAAVQTLALRPRLSSLRSRCLILRRHIAPQRDMVGRLAAEQSPLLTETDRHRLREDHEQLIRAVEDLNLIIERLVIAQEMLAARVNERLSRNTYLLSIVAAIFLPLGLVVGLLGVNLGGIPGTEDPRGFWVLCGVLGALLVVELVLLRKMRWM